MPSARNAISRTAAIAMQPRRVLILLLSALPFIVGTAASTQLELSGQLTAENGTCRHLSESELSCRISAGTLGTLLLSAEATPPECPVLIEASGLPPWAEYSSTSQLGSASATVTLKPPLSSSGHIAVMVLVASTPSGLQTHLHVQVEIVSSPPQETVPRGTPTDRGTEFETPFLPGISTFVLGDVLDCVTGAPIPPDALSTEFLFTRDAEPPYDLSELEAVVLRAPGYSPRDIRTFETTEFSLFFLQVRILSPKEPAICLQPIGDPSLRVVAPLGPCVGHVSSVLHEAGIDFQWASTGRFLRYEILIYDNPCGRYPPPPDPTPTPTPSPSPSPTPTPQPSPGQPVVTTAGVWEPLWEKLTPTQRDALAGRGLSGWAWVAAARELLEKEGDAVPVEAQVMEAEGILLPDTRLLARFGPFPPETLSATLPLEAVLEPGQAFVWHILGVATEGDGHSCVLLSEAQCVRYQPRVDHELVPVTECPRCASAGPVWDCHQPIQLIRPLDIYPKKASMNPDERLSLSLLASDMDMLLWKCECLEETQRRIGAYPERVTYDWTLHGRGTLVDSFENSAVYEMPVDLAPGEQITVTIEVSLNAPRGGDPSTTGRVILTLTAPDEGCEDYAVASQIIQPEQKACPPPLQEYGRDCVAVLKYGKADGPISGVLMLPTMAYVGEPVLLKATHTDVDELTIQCERTVCIKPPEVDHPLQDPLAFTWDDGGAGGLFPLGSQGRCVVYIPATLQDVTVHCSVQDLIVRDPPVDEREPQPVAQVVIDLTRCDGDWLPENGNSTPFTARVYEYRHGRCTFPGPARRILFDLTEISAEIGYCVNRGDSLENDLFFSADELEGTFHLCDDQTLFPDITATRYFARAISRQRTSEVSVSVHSEDYGSYGQLEATAFNARSLMPRLPDQEATCRLGSNAVSIPRDDVPAGGNHIADRWDARYPDHQEKEADQDRSLANPYVGDGLTRYQEYRGVDVDDDGKIFFTFDVSDDDELSGPINERLSPDLKDLFVTTLREEQFGLLAYGKAFETSRIVVHPFFGSDRSNIDVMLIDPRAGLPPNALYTTPGRTDLDGHLNKLGTPVWFRYWNPDWMGGSTIGTSGSYGEPLVFDRCIWAYFYDKPYVDGATLANPNAPMADRQWSGPANGVLDAGQWVQDLNDNGLLDANEPAGAGPFTGLRSDRLSVALPWALPWTVPGSLLSQVPVSLPWAADLSPYDVDNNGLVEVAGREYDLDHVTLHILTHEMGHAAGIPTHCTDPTCLMFEGVPNWDRQDHFCDRCRALLRIHNR